MITIIAAAGENNELGKDNDLVWHLPADFKRFKQLTTGHPMIMGRKTFESFPKPLPGRLHIIITRNENYKPQVPEGREEDVVVVNSIDAALIKASIDATPYIIGGGEIYKLGMEVTDRIELTRVHGTFDVDTYFPEFDKTQWELVSKERHEKDEKHKFAFTYETWERV